MISMEWEFCGFGVKHRFEFGDPRRSPITVLELGIIKFYKFKTGSKFVDFMRGYCDNDDFGWHPKVRLAKRKAEKKASNYYQKVYKEEADSNRQHYFEERAIRQRVEDENRTLLKAIELKQNEQH